MQIAAIVIVFNLSIAAFAAYYDAYIRAWLRTKNSKNIQIKRLLDLLTNEWPYCFSALTGFVSAIAIGFASFSLLLAAIVGFAVTGITFVAIETRRILQQNRPIAVRSDFYPLRTLSGKSNYKRYIRVNQAGFASEHIYLNIPEPSLRERIICTHYLMFLSKRILQDEVGFDELSRDSPWDFSFRRHDGLLFNVEVTAIADNELQFRINKREDEFTIISDQPKIKLRRLQKMVAWFPDEEIENVFNAAKQTGLKLDDEIENPYFTGKNRAFNSPAEEPKNSFSELLKQAIDRKSDKAHEGKDRTVLVLDNRTSAFSLEQLYRASDDLAAYFENAPFKEIWFYTGFYSELDGNESEFSMLPLKAPKSYFRAIYGHL